VTVEIENRSGTDVDEPAAEALARRVLSAEGIEEGDLGLLFVGPDEMRTLKREHLGQDEATDVLSFPIDGRDDLPDGVPRQLGDAVLCPQVVGERWQAPLVHGLLHLLGYDHGVEMERREAELRVAVRGRRVDVVDAVLEQQLEDGVRLRGCRSAERDRAEHDPGARVPRPAERDLRDGHRAEHTPQDAPRCRPGEPR